MVLVVDGCCVLFLVVLAVVVGTVDVVVGSVIVVDEVLYYSEIDLYKLKRKSLIVKNCFKKRVKKFKNNANQCTETLTPSVFAVCIEAVLGFAF